MDADETATVFVEMCTRLDELIDAQRTTNEMLGTLEGALRDHLAALAEDRAAMHNLRPLQRGLGRLIPHADDHGAVAAASGQV
jgi:hypothetical protein